MSDDSNIEQELDPYCVGVYMIYPVDTQGRDIETQTED
jgi:hypothetical protein